MFPRLAVFVIDDDASSRRELCELIGSRGFTVTGASNAPDAVRILTRTPVTPGLILLDLNVPPLAGATFREWQLANERLRFVPVVPLSPYPFVTPFGADLGGPFVIAKPFRSDEVLCAVEFFCAPKPDQAYSRVARLMRMAASQR